MQLKIKKTISAFLIFSFAFFPFYSAEARFFDPNDIFTDNELLDSNSLSRTAIQTFLESKNSVLKNVVQTVDGVPKLVSEMIYEIGRKYGISQKFLLAKLQHEQGLVEKSTASQTAIDWATGFSCYNSRCNDKFKGIYNQLDAAAEVQKIYIERSKNSGYFGFSVGKQSKTSDGKLVTPTNQATTNLYIYTPYQGGSSGIGGNYAFWRVWNRYFTERVFPDGAILKNTLTGEYWKIENNKKRKFASSEIYLSDYSETDAVPVNQQQLSYYQTGEPIVFSNNAIVKAQQGGLMYLLSDNKKHRLIGNQALAVLGYTLATTETVKPYVLDDDILEKYEEGEPITEESVYPLGVLVKTPSSGIYLLKNGFLHPLLDEAVWQENYNNKNPVIMSSLGEYTMADPIKLKDGSIVKDSFGTFYVISNQAKHKVSDGEIIKRIYGQNIYQNTPIASSALLDLHDTTDTIDYINDTVTDPVNYVSYAQKVGGQTSTQNQTPASVQNYLTLYDQIKIPQAILAGQSSAISVSFRNRGSATWQPNKIFLKLIDENSSSSSLVKDNRIALDSVVVPNGIAEFSVNVSAPTKVGKIKQWFILEYENESGQILEMPGGLVGKDIIVSSGISAEVEGDTIPVAIRNKWSPIDVEVRLKNTSTSEIWTSRRTALILKSDKGDDSPFYDPADWIDEAVVGVPLNKSKIAPGEIGVIKFTIDPRGVTPGVYSLIFSGELRDAEKELFINGDKTWEKLIRVDP